MEAKQNFIRCGYVKYFKLNIFQRINERQKRNSMNINNLYSTVLKQSSYTRYDATHPQINNGLYHHYGKTHSKYPKVN